MKKPNTKKHLRLFCNSSESIRGENIDSLSNDFKFLKDIFNKKPQENSIFKIKYDKDYT